jgi:phage gpG-like protein
VTEFSVEVLGVQGVLDRLAKIQGRAANVTTELLRDTGLIIQSEVDEVFNSSPGTESGGTVQGGRTWPALTDAYLKQRPDRRGGQILRDTGELLGSLTVGGKRNILTANSDTLTFGTALPKGRGLQKKREFLFVTDSMTSAIANRWEQFIVEGR